MRVDELLQDLRILVVDVLDIMLAEITLFLHDSYGDGLKRNIVGTDLFLRVLDLVA